MVWSKSQPKQLFQLSKLLHADGRFATFILRCLESILGLDRIAELYYNLPPHDHPHEYFHLFLEAMRVTLQCDDAELAYIPRDGACVLVANHPSGMIDGIALGALLARRRTDFKFIGNYMLEQVPDMRPFNIPVDPFNDEDARQRNIAPLRATMRWLAGGGALVLFPAGEVAHYQPRLRRITDSPWQENLARVLRRAHAPVFPVFLDGRNSWRFQVLGLLHPMLRSLQLGTELLNKSGKTLPFRIGAPIAPERLADFTTDTELMAYLRAETYALAGTPATISARPPSPVVCAAPVAPPLESLPEELVLPGAPAPEPIAPPDSTECLCAEIRALPPETLLCTRGEYQVFFADAAQIPHMLREIGRQREISFRLVGEGTGKALDLDHFDQYYQHLFLWNHLPRSWSAPIASARRMSSCGNSALSGYIPARSSVMMPRCSSAPARCWNWDAPSCGRNTSARTPSLYLLWRGIGQCIARNPQYRYLFGAVSISDEYSSMSRQLMTAFLSANHLWEDLTTCVSPLHPLSASSASPHDALAATRLDAIADLDALSALVLELEHGQRGIPVLLKHYLRLGGRLLGFNIDPQFSNVIDGLILVDLLQAPPLLLEKYIGADTIRVLRNYHQQASTAILS